MKTTIYFKHMCSYSNTMQIIDKITDERDEYLKDFRNTIGKIESEDLRVDAVGNNQAICIIRLTYHPK